MLDKIYVYFVSLIIALLCLSFSKSLNSIEKKVDVNQLNVRIVERIQVLEELNFSYDDILSNVNGKYGITNEELKKYLKRRS